MGFWVGTYGLNFCYDFWNFFEDRKMIIFKGIYIFFQSMPGNKSYAQISSKQGRVKKKLNSFLGIFSLIDSYFSTFEALNHSI